MVCGKRGERRVCETHKRHPTGLLLSSIGLVFGEHFLSGRELHVPRELSRLILTAIQGDSTIICFGLQKDSKRLIKEKLFKVSRKLSSRVKIQAHACVISV